MPYIKKGGITYGGFPNATVASKEATAIVPSSIKQLTRVGGTQEFAPVTIPEAVKFSEGGSLETTVNSIATIESSSTASKAYVVGDFLVSGGQLYKVIADIAIGETFVVDTNIESTSVGSELSELNAGLSQSEYYDVTTTLNTIMRFRKIGNLVVAYYNGNLTVGAANTKYTIAVIPVGYVPIDDVYTSCVLVNTNNIVGTARIHFDATNQRVHIVSSIAGTEEYRFSIAYYIN